MGISGGGKGANGTVGLLLMTAVEYTSSSRGGLIAGNGEREFLKKLGMRLGVLNLVL